MSVSSHLKRAVAASAIVGAALAVPAPANAGIEPFLGEMMMVGYTFCPRNFAEANGLLLPIAQNTALFSLLGTTFGGNGQTTFALPDLRGRAPINQGQGPGLSNYVLGQIGGQESFTLLVSQMPAHNHLVNATNTTADKTGPGGKFLALASGGISIYHEGPANKVMDPAMITPTGGSQPVGHRGPYLAMRWCIATNGIFPSRP
ncbi:MAG: phage tail protein [Mesorhizobium sp.]|nr:phage tail protein [Mesorhizobium sp.]